MAKMVMDHKQVLEQLANLVVDEENCAAQSTCMASPGLCSRRRVALVLRTKSA